MSDIAHASSPASGAPAGPGKPDEDEIVLSVLDVVERDRFVTHRKVAGELGIAVGLANAYVRRCVRKGLIKVSQVPTRRYAYYLTPQGFAEKSRLTASFLSHSFAFFRRARVQCGACYGAAVAKGQRRLLLIGAGDLADVAHLVAGEQAAVTIVGIVEASTDAARLRAAAEAAGEVDGVVVVALVSPREVYSACVAAFGVDRVHAPEMLRIPRSRPADGP